ncbi:hypothetical protein HanPSC8_Chr14g0613831 [Helianthus annuus]|nr:hypothetical protein HanPSC8_Chr14g0613831 [Helianthus annuus]
MLGSFRVTHTFLYLVTRQPCDLMTSSAHCMLYLCFFMEHLI